MPERRTAASSSTNPRATNVRRNLFHQHLSRRPTTSSTSTSAETLRLDIEPESDTSDIVIRDKNGEFEVGDPPMGSIDEQEDGNGDALEDERERRRLADAVKHHTRDRNRPPSEPAELLEAVKTSLRAKVAALAEDNWMYEAEEDTVMR
ncbi:hypothetical protein LHYA1_G002362 [Lachnellula hyalina]|uniref:Uncharacterized protein n=1 Tax=Lachnellula hyalina TaxID=1316788 RepID=A0A8H8R614_9HELO|nr:uncharacterized protein LHYA1_G002362 [Lachnellula hyalina]TVY28651.1 hypothetical protein LHYA1_G002362 [Lachnellula hyalina]